MFFYDFKHTIVLFNSNLLNTINALAERVCYEKNCNHYSFIAFIVFLTNYKSILQCAIFKTLSNGEEEEALERKIGDR